MRTFDASSILHAWDNYPIGVFPPVWDWLANEIGNSALVISDTALEEVGHRNEACRDWIRDAPIKRIDTDQDVLLAAEQFKQELGIKGDNYHPKGVDENDLLIIASAYCHGYELISNEAVQNKLPAKRWRYKIPAVCQMASVAVPCKSFIGFVVESGVIFEGPQK